MSKLTPARVRALRQIRDRNVAVVWHAKTEYPGLGYKPWYALTGGVLPVQLHSLWLDGLIRLDRNDSAPLRLATDTALLVARARLTPMGKVALFAGTQSHRRPTPSLGSWGGCTQDRFLSTGRERTMG